MAPDLHPDFHLPWVEAILASPSVTITEVPTSQPKPPPTAAVSNAMFLQTLYHPTGIKFQLNFQRQTSEPDSIRPTEYCYLLSIGPGIDGKTGRAHGGFNALVLDQMLGSLASMVGGKGAPATATMTVDYVNPIDTPGVVLVRGWAIERSGRKTWVRGTVEGEGGKVFCRGKALFVDPREEKM